MQKLPLVVAESSSNPSPPSAEATREKVDPTRTRRAGSLNMASRGLPPGSDSDLGGGGFPREHESQFDLDARGPAPHQIVRIVPKDPGWPMAPVIRFRPVPKAR